MQGAITVTDCPQVHVERVFLTCEGSDLRSASCLAVYNPVLRPSDPAFTHFNPVFAVNDNPQRYNLRVLNSQCTVGHFQVGILVVNADRAQIEGNFVLTPQTKRNIDLKGLAGNDYLGARIRKQMLHSLTIVNTAPPASKGAKRRLRKLHKANAETTAAASQNPNAPAAGQEQEARAGEAARQPSQPFRLTGKLPPINLGTVGRSHVTSTFGTLKLQFVSSQKLSDTWTNALVNAGLNQNSTARQVHNIVNSVADTALKNPDKALAGFRAYFNAVLPELYSTSAQGIVVAGDMGNDIRILNNTIDGTAQGVHVGWSDRRAKPYVSGLQGQVVQISGNTINIRLTPEMTGDRHGIFVGCVQSAVINDNHVQLFRGPNAGQDIFGIKIVGVFGPRLLVERNAILGFTYGLYTDPSVAYLPQGDLWKAADNVSTSPNVTSSFKVTDNVP